MKKLNELIIEDTNTKYQLRDIKKKIDGIISDPERFRLTQKYRQKKARLKQVQSELLEVFDNIM